MLTQKNKNTVGLIRSASPKTHPVKLTALAYIREALVKEHYEAMKELVAIAQEFGADVWEIRKVLTRSEAFKK